MAGGNKGETLDEAARVLGADVLTVQADVTQLADIDKLLALVKNRFGKIDALFVNAGTGVFKPFDAVNEADFGTQMDTNFKGAYFRFKKPCRFSTTRPPSCLTPRSLRTWAWPTPACTPRAKPLYSR